MNYNDLLQHEKLIKIWKKISGKDLFIDDTTEFERLIYLCERKNINFQYDYLKKLNIAYNYCKNRYHYKTNKNLLDAVLDGDKIYINSYLEEKTA